MPYVQRCQPGRGGDCPTAPYEAVRPSGLPPVRDSQFIYAHKRAPAVVIPERGLVPVNPLDGCGSCMGQADEISDRAVKIRGDLAVWDAGRRARAAQGITGKREIPDYPGMYFSDTCPRGHIMHPTGLCMFVQHSPEPIKDPRFQPDEGRDGERAFPLAALAIAAALIFTMR